MRKIIASVALFAALLAGSLAAPSPAQAHYTNCRSEGWCMWLYENWENPGHNGWQWDAAWIAARPGGILKFGTNQWNNYTAGWYLNSSIYQGRLYLDANCTGTRYLYFDSGSLKFASPDDGALNHDFYRTASCVRVFQI